MSTKAIQKLPPIPAGRSNSPNGSSIKTGSKSPHQYNGLAGPSYQLTVKGDNTKHTLPQPSTLKPFVDTQSGALDSWPAHCTSQATTKLGVSSNRPSKHSKQSQLKARDNEGEPYQSMVPKPKFLEQLENFLRKELRNAETDGTPSETRLQAFREVFEYLIEDFKTYKPLLSAIKNEYEMKLSHQREQIRELEPLKAMLVTVSEQCNQKIMAFREEERQDITNLKQEKLELLEKIDAMKEEHISLQMQIEKLQDEVAVEYMKYRDECDARKLLVSDINDLSTNGKKSQPMNNIRRKKKIL
ncbi:putative translin-associated factor X-interacting protein 1-like [Apostichopus japonicus]|uniref:Putative translin-associated factor X-interacting protein 1-like n=1 Tax=Stichopus japonicus TaxID=307972 RepID=A0A2G8KC16_STIJA|nr:putative translin-associated factor X-interacting protein 1-like [Apostichopus japonicus]